VTLLLVALGAGPGAVVRYLVAARFDGRSAGRSAGGLHWGTIGVNAVGSLLLGACSGAALAGAPMALLGTGFCGAMTTFSAFAVQAHDLGPRKGAATVALTVVPALALCFLGFWLTAGRALG
jgi:CrcB protein